MTLSAPVYTFERGLPASIDSERSILGAILIDNVHFNEADVRIVAEDFALDSHRRIYARMAELIHSTPPHAVDIVTLAEALARKKEIESIGGVAYLASLTEGLPRRISIAEYVRIVKEKSTLRRLIAVSSDAVTRAADQSEDADDILQAARQEIEALASESAVGGLQLAGAYLRAEFPTVESMTEHPAITQGIPTGMTKFDEMTCGFQKSELIIVAARPAMGKTSWAINAIEHAVIVRRKTVAFFSAEMLKRAILDRMICSRGQINLEDFRNGRLSFQDRGYFADVKDEIESAPLYLDDKSDPTCSYIRAHCQKLQSEVGLDLVVVDYIQLLSAADAPKRYSREQDVAHISKSLKKLAKELNVPVIALAQLSRANEAREEKRPRLSDLRESGSIEQDADVVAFLHREGYYKRDQAELKDKAEIILAKQRNGPVGTVHLEFGESVCRWADVLEPRGESGRFWA